MSIVPGNAQSRSHLRDLSPTAQLAAGFFRSLARTLKMSRLYKRDNPVVQQGREMLMQQLNEALALHGPWQFRITPYEILMLDEAVVRPSSQAPGIDATPNPEEKLPFLFYRDGIRALTLVHEVSAADFEAFFDALQMVGVGANSHDDLVTLLWQANAQKIRIETVPFSQTIYLHSRRPTAGGGPGAHQGQSYVWSPAGAEIRADIGQMDTGPMGLHRDTFDDWPLPAEGVDVPEAYKKLEKGMQFVRSKLLAEAAAESAIDWQMDAQVLLEKVLELDDDLRTRAALAHSVMTWLMRSIQDSQWDEAQQAFALLRRFDPDGRLTETQLTAAISELDTDDITDRLDESQNDDQGRFFALAVAMGAPAVDLACAVMAKAQKSRTRAAACTMLCYLCSEAPEMLSRYLRDNRWYVVRNTVFVLGQIGGSEVVPLLEIASHHPEPRVRRAVVAALGNCPGPERVPLLITQLDSRDPQLLASALNMLGRFKSPLASRAILRQIEDSSFARRGPENQRTLFNALAEAGDDEVVPNLEALLNRGGWFAQASFERNACARVLARIGTERAMAALEAGLRAHSMVVRNACLEALNMKGA